MKKMMLKTCLALIFSTLFISIVHASNHIQYLAKPKQYIIRITSENPDYPLTFSGSYYASSNLGSKIARIDKVTPVEITETTNNLTFMFIAQNDKNGLFRVTVLEKDASGEHMRLFSKNQSQYGMISTDGMAIIGE